MFGAADVFDEGGEVGFVVGVVAAVLVVPSLVPADSGEFYALAVVVGKEFFHVPCHLVNELKSSVIEIPGIKFGFGRSRIFANAGWQEVMP